MKRVKKSKRVSMTKIAKNLRYLDLDPATIDQIMRRSASASKHAHKACN